MRVVEHYSSVQGEGPKVGQPTQFVRFAGCNYKCAGWACDTQHAIDPRLYRDLQVSKSDEEIVADAKTKPGWNICLTGGEPMMQGPSKITQLAKLFIDEGYSVEMFSNGSFLYSTDLLAHVDIVMDWKLAGSGEGENHIPNRVINLENMDKCTPGRHSVKFVCIDQDDVEEALAQVDMLGLSSSRLNVYFGVVWGKWKEADLVDYLLARGLDWQWKLNVQLHNHIWPANERLR